jgi:hypothetical protein
VKRSWIHPALGFVIVLSVLGLWTSDARADGFDVVWFWTRMPSSVRMPQRAILALLLLATDYALNAVVMAWPASRLGVPIGRALHDLIFFTAFAQFADRLGMFVSFIIVGCIQSALPGRVTMASLAASFPYVVALNFVTSGLLVLLASRYLLARRWNVPQRSVRNISVAAAIFTNPAWAIGIAPLLGLVQS